MDRLRRRFLNRSAILTWFIRVAIIWVVTLPLALRAIVVLVRLHSAAPPALVTYFFALVIAKALLLVLLSRALDRVQSTSCPATRENLISSDNVNGVGWRSVLRT
jgi:hypothetical protein